MEVSDIHDAVRKFETTFAQGNIDGIVVHYTNTAMAFPPASDLVQGRQVIGAFWQEAMDMGIRQVKLDILEVEMHGDTAI